MAISDLLSLGHPGQSLGAGFKSTTRSTARARDRRSRSLAAGPSNSIPTGNPDVIPAGRTTLGKPAELLGAMLRANATRAGTTVPFISTSNPGDVKDCGNRGAGMRTTGENYGPHAMLAEIVAPRLLPQDDTSGWRRGTLALRFRWERLQLPILQPGSIFPDSVATRVQQNRLARPVPQESGGY